MRTNRIARTYEAWDKFVAECASEGLVVDPHAMTEVLCRIQRATRWECWTGVTS